jgi:phosphohistidine phosphatase
MEAVRYLSLLRHAKSSWADEAVDDHARPLSPRGEAAAGDMATYMRREAVEPALVLCSAALRARQTLAALALAGEVYYEDGLYGAGATYLMARLHTVADDVGSVMVVAHNPGLHDLAVACAGEGEPGALARLREKLPTGALVKLSFAGPWASLVPGGAVLEALVLPREL